MISKRHSRDLEFRVLGFLSPEDQNTRITLHLNMTCGQELVALHRRLFMFGVLAAHTWRYCGGLIKEHSLSVH